MTCSMLLLLTGGVYVAYTIRMTEAVWVARKLWQDFKSQTPTPRQSSQRPDMIAIETCQGIGVTTAQTRFAFAAVLTDEPHSALAAQKLGVSLRQHSQLDMILLLSAPNNDSRLDSWKPCVGDAWKLPNYYEAVLLLDLDILAMRDPSDIFTYKFESCRLAAVSGEKGVLLMLPGAKQDDDICELPRSYNSPAVASAFGLRGALHPSIKLLHFADSQPWLQPHWSRPREMQTCWGIEALCTLWWLM